jgi:hypothetical protein
MLSQSDVAPNFFFFFVALELELWASCSPAGALPLEPLCRPLLVYFFWQHFPPRGAPVPSGGEECRHRQQPSTPRCAVYQGMSG